MLEVNTHARSLRVWVSRQFLSIGIVVYLAPMDWLWLIGESLSSASKRLSHSLALHRAYELQQPTSTPYKANRASLVARLDKLESEVRKELARQGFDGSTGKDGSGRVEVERMMNMRFDGTDTALMVLPTQEEVLEGAEGEDFERAFKRAYRAEFGFLLEGKSVIVDDVKVSVLQEVRTITQVFLGSRPR